MPASVDLNADLGEGGPSDHELLRVVTSTSIACAYHAGDPITMLETARAAARLGVAVGAHPSYADKEGFGRVRLDVTADRIFADVLYQVGAMAAAAEAAGSRLTFVKPHGALYNAAATDPGVAEPLVQAVAELGLSLLCPAASEMQQAAARLGVRCYAEAFADRAYSPDGTLAPRHGPNAVIEDPEAVAERALRLVLDQRVVATDGSEIAISADSICIHGDTPGAVSLARSIRRSLEAAGVVVRPFAAS